MYKTFFTLFILPVYTVCLLLISFSFAIDSASAVNLAQIVNFTQTVRLAQNEIETENQNTYKNGLPNESWDELWTELMPGLSYGILNNANEKDSLRNATFANNNSINNNNNTINKNSKSTMPTQQIHVIRIDPTLYSFRLYSSSWEGRPPMNLKSWLSEKEVLAVINASMYKEDNRTSVGYMRQGDYINNGHIGTQLGAFFVAQPKKQNIAPATIVYKNDENWEEKINEYDLVLQNYRLFSEDEEQSWQSKDKHSISAIATDSEGYILFLHTKEPISVHAFIQILKNYPLIDRAAYLEGGYQAGMGVDTPLLSKLFLGYSLFPSIQTPLPNIIAIHKK